MLPEVTAKPCRECPWRRKSGRGFLGPLNVNEWLELVHSDLPIACHMTIEEDEDWEQDGIRQCAGAAIYRSNVVKFPRDPQVARLPEDKATVLGGDAEFRDHHRVTW